MTSSDAPPPPGGPLRDDQPDGPLQPTGSEHGAVPDHEVDGQSDDRAGDQADDERGGSVPPVSHEPTQSEAEAQLQLENAETSLDQPSQ